MARIRLLTVDDWGGVPTERGHAAPDSTVRLQRGFVDRFDLTLAVLGPVPGQYGRTLPADCNVVYLPPYSSKWGYLRVRARTRRMLAEFIPRADLVLVRLPSFHGVDAMAIGGRSSVPCVLLLLGLWEETWFESAAIPRTIYSRAARWMTIRAAAKADLVLTQGAHLGRYLKRWGLDSLPVIESPLEADDFVGRNPQGGVWRAASLRAVAISRLAPMKNLAALVDAVHMTGKSGIDLHLKVVGGGELLGALRQQIRRLGLGDRVELLGPLDDRPTIRGILASADVFVLPSQGGEGVSLSVMEAMAAGLPVVAAPVGGLADILVAGKNAVLVKAPTPEEISEALISLAGDPWRRSDLGKAARHSARDLRHELWVERFHKIVDEEFFRIHEGSH